MLLGPRLYVNICVYAYVCVYIPLYSHTYECLSSMLPSPTVPCSWGPADLIYVVEGGALIWPVAITLLDTILYQGSQHDDDSAATLPHHLGTETQVSSILNSRGPGEALPPRAHLPEVCDCMGQWALGGDVGWHPRVVLNLRAGKIHHEPEREMPLWKGLVKGSRPGSGEA